jgi:hypothetical protein
MYSHVLHPAFLTTSLIAYMAAGYHHYYYYYNRLSYQRRAAEFKKVLRACFSSLDFFAIG